MSDTQKFSRSQQDRMQGERSDEEASFTKTDPSPPPPYGGAQGEARRQVEKLKLRQRFKEKKLIETGGMGRVESTSDHVLARKIALKTLLPDKASEINERRFLREAQITGMLEHPGIVPVHELGTLDDGSLYYTMKLVDGITLQQLIRYLSADATSPEVADQKIVSEVQTSYGPMAARLGIFVKICEAISFAHTNSRLRVIHRDLKPANIMIGPHGEVLVMDWGAADLLEPDEISASEALNYSRDQIATDSQSEFLFNGLTVEGSVLATIEYAAPEQLEGLTCSIDERADVYALGCILYHLVALRPPFDLPKFRSAHPELFQLPLKTLFSKIAATKRSNPINLAAPKSVYRQVPNALRCIIEKAMEPDIERRIRSVQTVVEALQKHLSGYPHELEPRSPVKSLGYFVGRHRGIAATAFLALVLVAIVASIYSRYLVVEKNRVSGALEGKEVEYVEKVEALGQARRSMYASQLRNAVNSWSNGDFMAARKSIWATDPMMRSWEYNALSAAIGPAPLRIRKSELALLKSPSLTRFDASTKASLLLSFDRDRLVGMRGEVNSAVGYEAVTYEHGQNIGRSKDGSMHVKWRSENSREGDDLAVFRNGTDKILAIRNVPWGGTYCALISDDMSALYVLADSLEGYFDSIRDPLKDIKKGEYPNEIVLFIIPISNSFSVKSYAPTTSFLGSESDEPWSALGDQRAESWNIESVGKDGCVVRFRGSQEKVKFWNSPARGVQLDYKDAHSEALNRTMEGGGLSSIQIPQVLSDGTQYMLNMDFEQKLVSQYEVMGEKPEIRKQFAVQLLDPIVAELNLRAVGGCTSDDRSKILVSGVKLGENEEAVPPAVLVDTATGEIACSVSTDHFGAIEFPAARGASYWRLNPTGSLALQQNKGYLENTEWLQVVNMDANPPSPVFEGSYARGFWDASGEFFVCRSAFTNMVEVRRSGTWEIMNSFPSSKLLLTPDIEFRDWSKQIGRIFAFGSVLVDFRQEPLVNFPSGTATSFDGFTLVLGSPPVEFDAPLSTIVSRERLPSANRQRLLVASVSEGSLTKREPWRSLTLAETLFNLQALESSFRPPGW